MTLKTHTLMRVALVTLGIFELSALSFPAVADQYSVTPNPCGVIAQSNCARLIVKPSFVVKNLHPAVTAVVVWCATKIGEPDVWATAESRVQTVYAGDATFSTVGGNTPPTIFLLKSGMSAGQVFAVTCELMLIRTLPGTGSSERRVAVASAASPQPVTDTNWNVVATGSVVRWTQNVTFPNGAVKLQQAPLKRGAITP